jgi:phosphoglycerate dehydrogenase-like enzyme
MSGNHDPSEAPAIAVEPPCWRHEALADAVRRGGGRVVPIEEATALVWADPAAPHLLPETCHSGIDWVQLPYAGIEPFMDLLDRDRLWTCGKGVYARPVAEHVLAFILAAFHNLGPYSSAKSWSGPVGRNLHGSNILVLGAGGITEELLLLLAPFECHITVLRRKVAPVAGAAAVGTLEELHARLPEADAVVLALAVTPATIAVLGAPEFPLMKDDAWVVNVARGVHIDTQALTDALEAQTIGGACIDVTDPEPLPDAHPLWSLPNCIITPHVANTPEMGLPLLAERVTENTEHYRRGEELAGIVDLDLGY